MLYDFGFSVGDTLYVVNPKIKEKTKRIRTLVVDCIKVFDNNITAHGLIDSTNGKWRLPTEVSVKHLNKRCVFTTKKAAIKWLEEREKNKREKE